MQGASAPLAIRRGCVARLSLYGRVVGALEVTGGKLSSYSVGIIQKMLNIGRAGEQFFCNERLNKNISRHFCSRRDFFSFIIFSPDFALIVCSLSSIPVYENVITCLY